MSFFIYLFLFISHFVLLVYIYVKICYDLGVILKNTFKRLLLKKNPYIITILTTVNIIDRPPATSIQRIPQIDIQSNIPNTITITDTEGDSSDDDYDSDDDIDISNREIIYEDTDKIDGKYYIGIAYMDNPSSIYLMNGTISTRSFFEFPHDRIVAYTRHISVYYVRSSAKLDILKLHILPDGVYEVSIHTFWIRIIQRAWRKTYAQRKHIIRLRGNIRNQEYFRNTGRYMQGTRVLPGIHGILVNRQLYE